MCPERSHVTRALVDVFGFESLRPGQGEIIDDVLAEHPCVAVMPTGAGKSLCYQLPAVLFGESGGVTLVVSPLIALMKDQVDALEARGIAAASLTSASGASRQSELLAGIGNGDYTIVYVAPERFRSPRFLDALARIGDRLALLAVDEAHCISEWGHEFRPDYRRLGEAVKTLEPKRLIALTATATPEVRTDIARQLHMEDPRLHVRGFDRPNLYYVVEQVGGAADKSKRIGTKVRDLAGGLALVYAATRKNAERYASELSGSGLRARAYHAGLPDKERTRAQDAFMAGKLDAIVATNAFGMGIDKADIRAVIHADLPRSPEAYYQESGRGGRDGDPTDCTLLFNHSDVRLQEFLIEMSYPSAAVLRGLWRLLRSEPELGMSPDSLADKLPGKPSAGAVKSATRILVRHGFLSDEQGVLETLDPSNRIGFPPLDVDALARRERVERQKLRQMIEYAYHPQCRRQYVLEYFGDSDSEQRTSNCDGCDNCRGVGEAQPLSEEQTSHLRDMLGLVAKVPGRFGRGRLASLANGTNDDDRFVGLPERGCLRGQTADYCKDLLRALEGAGLLSVSRGDYPTLSITGAGKRVVRGQQQLEGVGLMIRSKRTSRSRKRKSAASKDLGPVDSGTLASLREWRTRESAERSVPAYVIFSNRTLDELARVRPATRDELSQVHGIGPNRLEAYGDEILAAIERS